MVNILLRLRARRQLDVISLPLSSGLLAPLDVVVVWVVMFQPLIGVAKLVDVDFERGPKGGTAPQRSGSDLDERHILRQRR